jgi:hypothetical protein
MRGRGSVTFGGVMASGVGAHMMLDDGSKWKFAGVAVGISFGGNTVDGVAGDFPGYSHIEGACTFSLVGIGGEGGSFTLRFGDTKGEIGSIVGPSGGLNFQAAGGFGDWSKA